MTVRKPPPSDALQNLLGRHWHHLPATEVGQLLETKLEAGLDLFEVKHRHERFGPNQLTPKPGRSPWMRFLLQFHNPLIYVVMETTVLRGGKTLRIPSPELVPGDVVLLASGWSRRKAAGMPKATRPKWR